MQRMMTAGVEPVSPASAAAFRVCFGLLGLVGVVRFAARGWISELYIEPAHHLGYYGFAWVQPWPGWGMYLHFALLGVAAIGVALGYRYRLSIIGFFLLFTYAELIDQTTYLNHYYLVSLVAFIMVFLPLGRMASLDSKTSQKGGGRPFIPRSVLWVLQAQVGMVYIFAGITKLNSDWLFHAEPLHIWLYNSAGTPVIGMYLREVWVAYAMSWAGTGFDLTIVGWLLWNKTRPFAYAALVIFHLATAVLFPSIGMFPWLMIGLTLLFFEPDWPVRLAAWVRRKAGRPSPTGPSPFHPEKVESISWSVMATWLFLAVFLAAQVAVSLRHLAYPVNVLWTEEGYRFSWRVLLTEKRGLVSYRVYGGQTGEEWLVFPDEYLTPLQVERMSHQPSLILATAHIIRDDFAARGYDDVEVRADAFVAFNGRPASRLIDPDVDLARVRQGFVPKPWVLRAPE